MEANGAPERLYLSKNIYSTYLYQVPDPDDETAVEYTRTDAFIEKAEKWLNEHILDYVYAKEWGQGVGVEGELFNDFKRYIKGE